MRFEEESPAGNGIWKTAAVTLAGILVTGAGGWLMFAQEAVTRAEVTHMIARETPYLEDRKAIQEALARNNEAISRISEEVEQLGVQQSRVEAKLDALLSKRGG
jgi:uncharacterized protein HemX